MVETQLYQAAWLVVNVCSRQQLRENEGPGRAQNNDLSSPGKTFCLSLEILLLWFVCLFINSLYIPDLGNAPLGKKEKPWVVCALDEVRETGRLH